jgi:hypothetical protein
MTENIRIGSKGAEQPYAWARRMLPAIDGWYPAMVKPESDPTIGDVEGWTDVAMSEDDLVAILRALPTAKRRAIIDRALDG